MASDLGARRGLKLALCNEVLRDEPFEEQCRLAAAIGCTGLELAPFTLAADPSTLADADGARLRAVAARHGFAISSLHWLLVRPEGLSLATPDAALHARTLAFLERLVGFAAVCGRASCFAGRKRCVRSRDGKYFECNRRYATIG